MRIVSEHLIMDVLARAHPRPLSAAVIAWHLGRETNTRDVMGTLELMRKCGTVRLSRPASLPPVYGLAPPVCRVCGRDMGAGGTCAGCGEAA